jgi:reactive intermediate/imine deaminase
VRRYLSPDTMPPPFGYSQVVDVPASRILYLAGQVPLDRNGELVGAGDFEAQTRQVFDNVTAGLQAAGISWNEVVKLSYFVVDIGNASEMRAIRDEYINTDTPPASTLVEVSRLFRDDVLIEIEAVAVVE